MAKLVIINKEKPTKRLKSFKCKFAKLCSIQKELSDKLYHDGELPLPVNGDKIYGGLALQTFEDPPLWKNNTASITAVKPKLVAFDPNQSLSDDNTVDKLKYIRTNDLGICEVIECKNIINTIKTG